MSTLYIVATPIGNLEDISLRALRILGAVDFILCEDTRVTKRLLEHYKIDTPTISFYEHSEEKKIKDILELLAKDKNLALVTDAGTPAISDPGGRLVQRVIEEFNEDVKIESVPGPSAVTAALSISGIPTDKFVFMGFPPHKKGRQTFIRKIFGTEFPVVVYESKHRIIKFLDELKSLSEEWNEEVEAEHNRADNYYKKNKSKIENRKSKISLTSVVVCRELSKMHETVYRGDLETITEKIKSTPEAQLGEYVVIIGK